MKQFDRNHFQKKFAKLVKAPKVRKFGDARDKPDYGRARCTMPPRQRPGKTYPGGRRLRRALTRLESNRKGTLIAREAAGKGGKVSRSEQALKMPGAMNP